MKKLLSVILSIVVIFCIIPLGEISVGAAASENGYTYYAFSNTTTDTEFAGNTSSNI